MPSHGFGSFSSSTPVESFLPMFPVKIESTSGRSVLPDVSGCSTVIIGPGLYRFSAYHNIWQPIHNIRVGQKMLKKILTYFSSFHSLRNSRLT